MKRRTVLFCLTLILGSIAVTALETVDDALALIPDGLDVTIERTTEGRSRLEDAIALIEDALGVTTLFDHTREAAYMELVIHSDRKPWVNKLSQAYYTLGDVFVEGNDALKETFSRGQYWGLKSLRMSETFATVELRDGFFDAVAQETDVPALFWTYGNWARKDDLDVFGAIARNDPPKLEALIDRAFELDETYLSYAPYRALAAFWGGLPPLPLIEYGQNLPRALSYICPVIDEPAYCTDCPSCPIDPEHEAYLENRLVFAEDYLMEKELWAEAERVLQSILDAPVGDLHVLYNQHTKARAEGLLEEVRGNL